MAASAQDIRFYVAVALGVGIAASVAVVCGKKGAGDVDSSRTQTALLPDAPIADWCVAPYVPIPGGCLAAPPKHEGHRELLVYLHGMYAPGAAAEENERRTRVAQIATKKGFTVLALRGRQGQCSQEAAKTWFCFPSNEKNASDGPAFVASFASAFANADRRAGPFDRRVLLGFSNGGYFATLIATRALAPFDAVTIAGAGPVRPTAAAGARPPILLLASDEDPSVESMIQLDQELGKIGWPHVVVGREGGHALTDADVTHAVAFFERTRKESLPLQPPIATRYPKPKLVVDAGVEGGEEVAAVPTVTATTAAPAAATATATATATANESEPPPPPAPTPD